MQRDANSYHFDANDFAERLRRKSMAAATAAARMAHLSRGGVECRHPLPRGRRALGASWEGGGGGAFLLPLSAKGGGAGGGGAGGHASDARRAFALPPGRLGAARELRA